MTAGHALTMYDHLVAGQRLLLPNGQPLTSRISMRGKPRIAIGLDHGNDAFKLAILTDDGKPITRRIPTAYATAQDIRSGRGALAYRVDGGTNFWLGEVALELAEALGQAPDALVIGSTAERLADARLREAIFAALVEILMDAEFAPGAYEIALGFGVPTEEIVLQKDQLGVAESTRTALTTYLKGRTARVVCRDEEQQETTWLLTIAEIIPQAQGIGTLTAWSRTPSGALRTDVEAVSIVDIGGGDIYANRITMKPYRLTSERLGNGTIDLARALRRQLRAEHPKLDLSDVEAQQALITGRLRLSGRKRDISAVVRRVIQTDGQDILARIQPELQQPGLYVTITGGGVILLRDLILERATAIGKTQPEDYYLINHGMAPVLNAVGILAAVIFIAAGRKV